MRFTDCQATPAGSLLLGRMHSKWRDGQRGRVYRLDPGSAALEEVLHPKEVGLPNGMCWDLRRGLLFFVDSFSETITEYQADERVRQLSTKPMRGVALGH